MPELPEMETYKTLLTQQIVGKKITEVIVNRNKSINMDSDEFIQKVLNQKVEAIERRAKYLLFHLENGSCLLLHLMLGGFMFYGKEEERPDRTVQVQLTFGDKHLYFIGLRLGYLHLYSPEVEGKLKDIGPEPLDVNFSLDTFIEALQQRRGKLKTTLVDQEFLAGVGNRYSDEIAWHAHVLPERHVNDLNDQERNRLFQSIRFILQRAIQYGGYMEQPLFKDDTLTGGYVDNTYVYNREGEACKRCSTPIVKDKISSRKTFFCPICQN
ncbi:bifunctional DNA-formamidopyrimidine glycosylase/DNA-(apurinic or apyrimidinic site) lyase [Lentibacillus sp. L22]|uniref:bifunctional DNA-formamidopyrimidine glycosylase/DNA-(apurinic or apyrimidinic site) lyase n=1 Tax=Lentibacillus sp. L22 TaxID=3163028 RepID=UPI0034656A3C